MTPPILIPKNFGGFECLNQSGISQVGSRDPCTFHCLDDLHRLKWWPRNRYFLSPFPILHRRANRLESMKTKRIYLDTSVFGGVFDDEFSHSSQILFKQIKGDEFQLVTSVIVDEELIPAPKNVRNYFEEMLPLAEIVEVDERAIELRNAYLKTGIVLPKYSNDALHVALASVSSCTIIVSWNFKHIVHFDKIPLYNAINILHGYNQIAIYSPLEVIKYE